MSEPPLRAPPVSSFKRAFAGVMAVTVGVLDVALLWQGEWRLVAMTAPGVVLFGYAAMHGQVPWWLEALAHIGPTHVDVEVTFIAPSEGGRSAPPTLRGYSPHLRVPPSVEMLGVQFVEKIAPLNVHADAITATARLLYRGVPYHLLKIGSVFEIVEGTRVVGSGKVLRKYKSAG